MDFPKLSVVFGCHRTELQRSMAYIVDSLTIPKEHYPVQNLILPCGQVESDHWDYPGCLNQENGFKVYRYL